MNNGGLNHDFIKINKITNKTNMDITKIPFNQFIGLKISDKSGYLLMLDNRPEYRNHLDTVHASAMFALAEATSGYFFIFFKILTTNL